MSSETWTKPGPAICVSDSRIARSIPIRSMSLIVYALIPSSRIRSRSRASTRAEADERDALRLDRRERPRVARRSARPSRPIAAASGIPCTLPLGEDSGVFRSLCASIQSTPPSSAGRASPPSVPIATEWSPPSTSGTRVLLEREPDEPGDPAARRLDLGQVARALVRLLGRLEHRGLDVAPVEHVVADPVSRSCSPA